ncbi:MAG: YceI family protein [Ginsengibacter sp.]
MFKSVFLLFVLVAAFNNNTHGQIFYTKNGSISFFSKTIVEDIDAKNNQVISVINFQTGTIQFSLLNNGFRFPKAKMEEDFKANYMETDKYPRSTFKGVISDISNVNFSKDDAYKVNVKGSLSIHGVTKEIEVPGVIIVKNGTISAQTEFNVLVEDYKISVPSIVSNKIARSIQIIVNCHYEKK